MFPDNNFKYYALKYCASLCRNTTFYKVYDLGQFNNIFAYFIQCYEFTRRTEVRKQLNH